MISILINILLGYLAIGVVMLVASILKSPKLTLKHLRQGIGEELLNWALFVFAWPLVIILWFVFNKIG